MKVRAKETQYMNNGYPFIIKDKIYEIPEEEFDGWHFFKSEQSDVHRIHSSNIKNYFVIIPDKPKICEILGVEIDEEFKLQIAGGGIILDNIFYVNDNGYLINDKGSFTPSIGIDAINGNFKVVRLPKYTDEQKEIFKALKTLGYNYIARDSDCSIYAYESKPDGYMSNWHSMDDNCVGLETDKILNAPHLNFINWEDEEPFEIPEV